MSIIFSVGDEQTIKKVSLRTRLGIDYSKTVLKILDFNNLKCKNEVYYCTNEHFIQYKEVFKQLKSKNKAALF